jgi:hypothetical protein
LTRQENFVVQINFYLTVSFEWIRQRRLHLGLLLFCSTNLRVKGEICVSPCFNADVAKISCFLF